MATFPKNQFLAIFGSHLEFMHKPKNAFISETVQDGAILTKFVTPRVSAKSIRKFSQKSFSHHF